MSYFRQARDQYGFIVENTPLDEMRVVTPYRLVGATFYSSTKDTNFWTETVTSNGSVAISGGVATLSTNTTSSNGGIVYQSVRTARYVGASANRFRAQVLTNDTGVTNNSRKWGAFDGTDGAYFELDGTTLYIVTLKASTPTRVASASWNASTTVPTLTNVNSYEIYWTNAKVYFVIGGVLKHTVSTTTATWADNLNLPVRLSSTNSSGLKTNETLIVRVATISRLGLDHTAPTYKHIAGAATTVCKYAPGKLHRIVVNSAGTLCTIYDQTSGAVPAIAIIDTNKSTGNVGTYEFDCPFFTGLTIVTTGAGTDITVIYE